MPRLPRFYAPDLPLHVIQRGNDRAPIFGGRDDLRFFRNRLLRASREHGVAIHAYVMMTNHVHLLVTPMLATSVPKMMQAIGRVYVQYFNAAHHRTGTLWEGRYKAAIVDEERYLLTCMRYIEVNPVRAHMVASPAEFLWSSFRGNACGVDDALLSPHPIYRRLGGRRRLARPPTGSFSSRRFRTTNCASSATPHRTRGHWAAPSFGARLRGCAGAPSACRWVGRGKRVPVTMKVESDPTFAANQALTQRKELRS